MAKQKRPTNPRGRTSSGLTPRQGFLLAASLIGSGDWHNVTSTNVRRFKYVVEDFDLVVEFKNGSVYTYGRISAVYMLIPLAIQLNHLRKIQDVYIRHRNKQQYIHVQKYQEWRMLHVTAEVIPKKILD